MRLSALLIQLVAFGSAGGAAYLGADRAATWIEDTTRSEVNRRLTIEGHDWASVSTDGLQVILAGTAPSEADRFKALASAGTVVEAARILDNLTIEATQELAAPAFSLEILRNEAGISLIGLVPSIMDRDVLVRRIERIAGDKPVSDFMEMANYTVPPTWSDAVVFGLDALEALDRSKISIAEDRVTITASSDSLASKARLEAQLARVTPDSITTSVTISAPRPVITPFALRFIKDAERTGFDACSAESQDAADQILMAAQAAGMTQDANCREGLGVPSPNWAEAASLAIGAIGDLNGGTVTLTDLDVGLVALEGTDQTLFDEVTNTLEAELPAPFVLTAALPVREEVAGDIPPPRFSAARGADGSVQLRGDVGSELNQDVVASFAQSKFGFNQVLAAVDDHPNLPQGWSVRTMAGLAALAELNTGQVTVSEDDIRLSGKTGLADAGAVISEILTDRLGSGVNYNLNVEYVEALDPVANLLDPAECVAEIIALTDTQKITFEPGSTNLDSDSRRTVDQIAEILGRCPDAEIEISGHTDSQGREEMNLNLSKERAGAVLNALRIQRVQVKSLTAEGYGETQPIADNDTAEGREANRRIEFRLVSPNVVELGPDETPADETEAANE